MHVFLIFFLISLISGCINFFSSFKEPYFTLVESLYCTFVFRFFYFCSFIISFLLLSLDLILCFKLFNIHIYIIDFSDFFLNMWAKTGKFLKAQL